MSLEIIQPGLLTTVQDLGRYQFQDQGINVSGAMDRVAAILANGLVNNSDSDAVLEMSILGPAISFQSDQVIALTGADLSGLLDDVPIQRFRPIHVAQGQILTFQGAKDGRFGYLAIRGGMDIPTVLKSYSTNLKGGFGGFKGRALKKGDIITIKKTNAASASHWALDPSDLEDNDRHVIRAVKGPEWDWPKGNHLWQEEFTISQHSDRMGYRLHGPHPLKHDKEMISSAVTFGTIQVPTDGHPIILMADHQTTGGYPRVAQVITADLGVLAQAMPGKKIRFQEVSVKEAQDILYSMRAKLETMKQALRLKWS